MQLIKQLAKNNVIVNVKTHTDTYVYIHSFDIIKNV